MAPSMANNRAVAMLNAARAGRYGIPAMCCYNIEGAIATVRAAEAKRSPAMILLFPWAVEYAGSILVNAAASVAANASVPVTLHMDHAQTPEIIKQAASYGSGSRNGGFDSIMVDMSHHDKEENLCLTQELTDYLHALGIATEAEPGRIEGGEDGVQDTADLEGVLTTPDEGARFADTGIDWLAPAFGNVHGNYGPRGVQLEYDRLDSINKAVGERVNLVLHGSDPFTKEIFDKCIGHGVSKINLNKGMNNAYTDIQAQMAGKAPLTLVIEKGTEAMQKKVEDYMDMVGSSGKA